MAHPIRLGPHRRIVSSGKPALRLLCVAAALSVAVAIGLHVYPLMRPGLRPVSAVLTGDPAAAWAPVVTVPAPGRAERAVRPAPPPGPAWDGVIAPPIHSAAAVVLDAGTGALLFSHEPHRRLPPASVTKIVTAMVALERGDPDASVTVDIDGPAYSIETDSTVMGLVPGETLTLRDLLYGLMLLSGNDAAIAIADYIAGSEAAFVALMNAKAKELGLADTHFRNPHGLHDPDHYTSAHDIARLSLWAMRDPRFREIVEARKWTVRGSYTYTLYNKNDLLGRYPGADGLKLGWTEEAGVTLVGSATRDGRRLIVALLDTEQRVRDVATLFDWAFAHFRWE